MAAATAETLGESSLCEDNVQMAHYFESGFFVREEAWHGLGTVLKEAPRNTREALRVAGLDWHVNLAPVFCVPGMDAELARTKGIAYAPTKETLYCEDSRAMVREIHLANGDLKTDVLGIVGTRYVPLQNTDAFAWFDPLIGDHDVTLEAAGSVKEGRHVWILAKINTAPVQVGRNPQDVANPYLLLSNSHDGSRAVTVAFTPIRVVCWNTLSAANRAADAARNSTRKVRHTRAAANTLAEVRETINLASRDFSAKALLWREMATADLAPRGSQKLAAIVQRYSRLVFSPAATVEKARQAGTLDDLPEVRAEPHVWKLLHDGPGADSAGITPFGLYMAATHYSDHHNGHNASTRLASTWFGNGVQVRERAESEAMALAGIE
jgi:phage/plasmid-like protein (TIGR03299 family)